jgi:hypothetical protein
MLNFAPKGAKKTISLLKFYQDFAPKGVINS